MAAALADLGERERDIIGLRFGAELTGPQISELTGLSLANVQQILSRNPCAGCANPLEPVRDQL